MKPTISIFTADTGHTSISAAIRQSLPKNYLVHENNLSGHYFSLYTPFYLYFPQLFKIPFALSQKKEARRFLNAIVDKTLKTSVLEIFAKQRPDLVISTWAVPNRLIENLVTATKIPFINIVPDPRTFHILEPSAKALNFVFDQTAANRCQSIGIPPSQIITSGWFVRKPYLASYSQVTVRHQLGISASTLTFLVASGSEGTNWVLKILPAFIKANRPINVFFACGNNHHLYTLIKNMSSINHTLNPNYPVNFIPLKFTSKLYLYLQAADLVIGKAGPNLLFESIATKTPFFAITHISGLEDGNLDLIREYQLGFVEENTLKANRLLRHIIANPDLLSQYKPHLDKLIVNLWRAPQILDQTIAKLLNRAS